ncbi:hypothetical protein COCCU_13140 [Corynebacterium occultum]|uniref:BioF2-like acetyltransferase domain-containing protein n=1 Tax=Corynebacterium occultum TaxID=2675219 RepID=A0A6B8W994_9CORY|nr:GNAT family N-acetyltransferase [Corynebacterium occultum]QGU08527.1 hypothetical protein COCCU_13140 [Corynebacterium occultum]
MDTIDRRARGETSEAETSVLGERFTLHGTLSPRLRMEWEELAARRGTRFSSRPSYAWTWFETLGKGELALATLHRDGRLVALLPLHSRRRLGITVHRLLGHGLGTIGEALAADAEALKALMSQLREARLVLELTHVPVGSPLLAELRADAGWQVHYRQDDHCLGMKLPAGTRARDLRSAKTLSHLRRARTRAEQKFGPLEFVVIRSVAELDRHWAEMVRLSEAATEQDRVRRLNLLGPEHLEFSRRFLTWEAEQGNLFAVAVLLDKVMAGCALQLQSGNLAEGWFTRFDPEFAALRPGHQLIEHLVDIHDAEGITHVDMMLGRNAYKEEWENCDYAVGTVFAVPRCKSWQLPAARLIRGVSEKVHGQLAQFRPRLSNLLGKRR